jgi:hypothetical protein
MSSLFKEEDDDHPDHKDDPCNASDVAGAVEAGFAFLNSDDVVEPPVGNDSGTTDAEGDTLHQKQKAIRDALRERIDRFSDPDSIIEYPESGYNVHPVTIFDKKKCSQAIADLQSDRRGVAGGGDKRDADVVKLEQSKSNAGRRGIRVHTCANVILDAIINVAPNFGQVATHLHAPLSIAAKTSRPVRIPPILLVGAPGVGKTRAARKIAECLVGQDGDIYTQNYGGCDVGSSLGGLDKAWSNSQTGKIFDALSLSRTANPVFILDEIDKISSGETTRGHKVDPAGELLQLLEVETARRFTDKCLDLINFNASFVTYIATANSLAGINTALLSRFTVILARKPTAREAVGIIDSIITDISKIYDITIKPTSGDILMLLSDKNPRTIYKLISHAIVYPILHNRDYFIMSDIQSAVNLICGVNDNVGYKREMMH